MRRRGFMAAAAALALSRATGAATPAVKRRLVVVDSNQEPDWRAAHAKWFGQDGWAVGRDLEIEYVAPPAGEDDFSRLARRLVASKPDAILVGGEDVGRFIPFTRDIPLVFANLCCDPVRLGLVRSLNRPGGNVTGTMWPELLVDKQWEVGKQLEPRLKRIGILHDPDPPILEAVLREAMRGAAQRLRIEPVEIRLPAEASFAQAETLLREAKVDAVDVGIERSWEQDLMRWLERRRMVGLWGDGQVQRGGLAGVWSDGIHGFREAVAIVDHILRGARAADIPVVSSRMVHIGLNMGAVKRMGIHVPPALLTAADLKFK